ncbi:hypothetical protein INS49_012137 [Diaporthe citri]|uniref:uncharacterized protein n=1 Tax=Diaporthe citri TaxID=83186 RepID=UPI001C7E35BE|nr:uncharacterized protein INS49_012137 [Diaporthe citri]KAG6358619.1 hypothetical protein INS49_012137 [Diaporthe citri]
MGQYWKLVDIDRREKLLTNDAIELLEILRSGSLKQLVELIRNPKWRPFRTSTNHLYAFKLNSARSSLLRLPQEVIDMIVCNLSRDSSESVIYLSLTCAYFFRLLGPAVQSILARDTAPWAGDRLIFVGEFADGLDIGGICTSDELGEFDKKKMEYINDPFYYMTGHRITCAMNQHIKTPPPSHGLLPSPDLRRAGALEQRVTGKLTLDDLQLFFRLAAIARAPQLSAGGQKYAPVLRNLTARKYVRHDTIAESDYAYSLGEVVAVFTQRTKVPSGTDGLGCIGEWAGHRFDVATVSDVAEEDWADASQLAIEKLRKGTKRRVKRSLANKLYWTGQI